MTPYLSIVVPCYNRVDILIKNLKSILEYDKNDIEVVVQDDCSSEPIEDAIISLNDIRVKYYKNHSNIGIDNYYFALKSAIGEYAWLTSYRDVIDKNDITQCIKLLNKKEPDLLLVSGKNCGKYKDVICSGDAAVYMFYTCFMYGTGIIYKHSEINFNKYDSNYGYDVWDYYPQTFLANDIIKTGRIYTSSLELFERIDYHTDNKSTWYNENRPFYPEIPARIHLLACYINDLLNDDRDSYRHNLYNPLLFLRFIEWVTTYIDFIKILNANIVYSKDLKLLLYKRFVVFKVHDYIDFLNRAKKLIDSSISFKLDFNIITICIYLKTLKKLILLILKLSVLNITKAHIYQEISKIEKDDSYCK